MAAITGGLSNYARLKTLDMWLGAQSHTPATGFFIALFLSAIDQSASGVKEGEVTGANYSRFSATNNLVNWLTATAPGLKRNTVDFNFPTAHSTWGNISCFMITDHPTGGNSIYWGYWNTVLSANSGTAIQILSGNLTIRESGV